MKKSLLCLAALSALALTGCKSGVDIPVSYTALSGPAQSVKSTIAFEVPACEDYKTKLESENLLKAKQLVQFVFPEAKYLACKDVNFKSMASFELPVAVGVDANKAKNDMAVSFIQSQVLVSMSKEALARANQVADKMIGFDPKDFEISLIFSNDAGHDWSVFVPSAIIDGNTKHPIYAHADQMTMPKDGLARITLSNVAALQVSKGAMAMAYTLTPKEQAK